MTLLLDILATHWLSIALLLAAGACGALAVFRKRNVPLFVTLAVGTTAFALGSLFLNGYSWHLDPNGVDRSVAGTLLGGSLLVLYALALIVLAFRKWNAYLAAVVGFVAVAAAGGVVGRPVSTFLVESAKSIVWTRFTAPWWLFALLLAPLVYLIGRRSLSGLGPVRRWVVIVARTLVVVLLALALAEPRIRRPSENMTVIFVVDRSASVPREREETSTGDPIDRRWVRIRDAIETSVTARYGVNRNDQFGVLLFGKRPKLAYPPTPVLGLQQKLNEQGVLLDENYTDIGAAIKLAMASFPEGSGKRVVLISDGNQNLGDADEQANLAKKNGVVIDAVGLAPNSRNETDVLVQSVDAPPVAATGTRPHIRVYLRNASPTADVQGTLSLIRVGGAGDSEPADKQTDIDIVDDDGRLVLNANEKPAVVLLKPGLNVFKFLDREQAKADTSYTYRAVFRPRRPLTGDRLANNTADAAVVARGTRKVLFLDPAENEANSAHGFLLEQMRKAKILYKFQHSKALPPNKTDLGVFLSSFDCIVLANVPYPDFTEAQAEVIRRQVYDQGCGLVMVGGPDSFGPGGYQQTPIEAALPVECEIKAKKAMGKGGLVLIMHASEMADGNKWQKEIAKLAIQRLNAADMVGVVDYGLLGGNVNWQIPFQTIGGGKQDMYAAIDKMNPGDMPDFDPFLQAAADTLADPKHGLSVKHCILISDGDPNFSNKAALKKMADNGITCTTIGVATHGVNEDTKMKFIAESTKDGQGNPGNFYKVTDPTKLPAIYVKETRKISQSFLYEKEFTPALQRAKGPADGFKQEDFPPLYGFVRTTRKQSPTEVMQLQGPEDKQAEQDFPVLSTWQYGLGKGVAFTSDARNDSKGWGREWAGSRRFQEFWQKTVRWAMRPFERGELAVTARYADGKVRVVVTVDATDEDGKPRPLPDLKVDGAVSPPGKPQPGDRPPVVKFKPSKNGYWEAEFDATEAGAYFLNVQASIEKLDKNGNRVIDSDTGKPSRDVFAARSGVTVPYSPEFVDLESNTALLRRLTEATGGQYFDEPETSPAEFARMADFYRPAPEVVRAVLPFWFWLVFAAGILLLVDVGVRRISLEFKEVRHGSRKLWAKLRRNEDLPDDEDGMFSKLGKRKQQAASAMAKRSAKKFEAGGDLPPDAAPAGADDYAADNARKGGELPPPPPAREGKKPAPEEDGDDFMSRMRKAKQRGQKKPGEE